MIFAEFYHLGLDGKPRPACGTDAFLKLDARKRLSSHLHTAREYARRNPRYCGFRIVSGRINDYNGSNATLWLENL